MTEYTNVICYSSEHTDEIKKRPHVGYWVKTKPNWFHRLMARILLGWKWEDKE